MAVRKISIEGLRGFSIKTDIEFAVPDHLTFGSGLTVMVGPNNSGKSTVIEAFHLLNNDNVKILAENIKNKKNNGTVNIELEMVNGERYSLNSKKVSTSLVYKKINNQIVDNFHGKMNIFTLSSRRNFQSTFSNNYSIDREDYKSNINDADYRNYNVNNNFGSRLMKIEENRDKFNKCLEKILSPVPDWRIAGLDNNNSYLEFSFNDIKHSSKGSGDGYINIFNIIDALYDSNEDNIILIDEPEISLHPDLQRKLFKLLVEYSKDKQIIVSTHSPYFTDWQYFSDKSKILRFKKELDSIHVYELNQETKDNAKKLLGNACNPHILSLEANEIFFLNDNVILTEGQDDVICYKKIFEKYDYKPNASFFGWGAGSADNIEIILDILKDLGYHKVFAIFDNNKKDKIDNLKLNYPNYHFFAIEANDVRNKKRDIKAEKLKNKIKDEKYSDEIIVKLSSLIDDYFPSEEGLVKDMKNYEINEKYERNILELISSMKSYFTKKHNYEIENCVYNESKTMKSIIDIDNNSIKSNEVKEDEALIIDNNTTKDGEVSEMDDLMNDNKKYDISNFEIENNEQACILIDKISMYVNNESNIINENVYNSFDNFKINTTNRKIKQLVDNYCVENNVYKYIIDKYDFVDFRTGDLNYISIHELKKDIYKVVLEMYEGINDRLTISILYFFIVDINRNTVKIKRKKILKTKLSKIINKI